MAEPRSISTEDAMSLLRVPSAVIVPLLLPMILPAAIEAKGGKGGGYRGGSYRGGRGGGGIGLFVFSDSSHSGMGSRGNDVLLYVVIIVFIILAFMARYCCCIDDDDDERREPRDSYIPLGLRTHEHSIGGGYYPRLNGPTTRIWSSSTSLQTNSRLQATASPTPNTEVTASPGNTQTTPACHCPTPRDFQETMRRYASENAVVSRSPAIGHSRYYVNLSSGRRSSLAVLLPTLVNRDTVIPNRARSGSDLGFQSSLDVISVRGDMSRPSTPGGNPPDYESVVQRPETPPPSYSVAINLAKENPSFGRVSLV